MPFTGIYNIRDKNIPCTYTVTRCRVVYNNSIYNIYNISVCLYN